MPDEDITTRIMTSILHYLRSEYRNGRLSEENRESMEVAIQCLESIYQIHDTTEMDPPLSNIFNTYISQSVVNLPEASAEFKEKAEKFKMDGNTAMTNGEYGEAIDHYTRAIYFDRKNAVYYCNRAAAHSKVQDFYQAINDCKIAIQLDPTYSKAYGRLGLAYCGLEDYFNALENYKHAVYLEPNNEGYIRNYELARAKLREIDGEEPDTPENQPRDANEFGSQPNRAGGGTSAFALPEGFDFTSVFGNPQLVNFANQLFTDPNMQNMISTFMTRQFNPDGSANQTVEDLVHVGQQLAQQLQSENPTIVEEFRAAFEASSRNPPSNEPQDQQKDKNQHDKAQ